MAPEARLLEKLYNQFSCRLFGRLKVVPGKEWALGALLKNQVQISVRHIDYLAVRWEFLHLVKYLDGSLGLALNVLLVHFMIDPSDPKSHTSA